MISTPIPTRYKPLCLMVAALLTWGLIAREADAGPLDNLVVVETESFTDLDGVAIMGSKETRSKRVFWTPISGSSGGSIITPVPGPFRIYTPFPKPVEAIGQADIPAAGKWYVNVR